MHWYPGENPCERDLSNGGADDVHGLELDQLVVVEVEVVGEAGNVGIVCTSVSIICTVYVMYCTLHM